MPDLHALWICDRVRNGISYALARGGCHWQREDMYGPAAIVNTHEEFEIPGRHHCRFKGVYRIGIGF